PSPSVLLGVRYRCLGPAIIDQPCYDPDRVELKIDPLGLATNDVEGNTTIWVEGFERGKYASIGISCDTCVADRAERNRKIGDYLQLSNSKFTKRKASGGS